MKVLMMTDIEGVAGVVSYELQTYETGRYYDRACRLLTAEINAAVTGLLEAGAEEILVYDGHGSGAVWFEDLHPAVSVLHGRPMAPRHVWEPILATYDVGIMVGQHGMAGVRDANLNHTQSSRAIDSYRLNGQLIGEIAQFALYMGSLQIPVIFLSGDEAACREAEALISGVRTCAVKQGLGRNSAISLSAAASHKRIRSGVKEALEHHRENPVEPLQWPGPYVLEKRFFHTDAADAAVVAGGTPVDDQTVAWRSDAIAEVIYR